MRRSALRRWKINICKSTFLLGCLFMCFSEIWSCNLKMFVFQSTFNCQHCQPHPKTDTFYKCACWFSRQNLKWLLKISDHLRSDSLPFAFDFFLLGNFSLQPNRKSLAFPMDGVFFLDFLKKGKDRRSRCLVRHIFLRLLQCCIGKDMN